jgi:hypothetical protein
MPKFLPQRGTSAAEVNKDDTTHTEAIKSESLQ